MKWIDKSCKGLSGKSLFYITQVWWCKSLRRLSRYCCLYYHFFIWTLFIHNCIVIFAFSYHWSSYIQLIWNVTYVWRLNLFKEYDLLIKKWVKFFSLFSSKPIKSLSHFLFFVSNKVGFVSISTKNKSYYCNIFKEGIPLKSTSLTYKYSVSLIITCKFV